MLLRDHPLMSYHGVPNWPPAWIWLDGPVDKHPKGEIGVLRAVLLSKMQWENKCFLLSFYDDSSYLGCLLFEDLAFCSRIATLLQGNYNRPIAEIGSLDLTHTL